MDKCVNAVDRITTLYLSVIVNRCGLRYTPIFTRRRTTNSKVSMFVLSRKAKHF